MEDRASDPGKAWIRDAVLLLVLGSVLGFAYNAIGQISKPAWGLDWIATDRAAELEETPVLTLDGNPGSVDGLGAPSAVPVAVSDDPMAPVVTAVGLPEIPDLGRPVKLDLSVMAAYVEADGAMIIDARDPDEYESGHIPGAINLPFDVSITDAALMETIDPAGRPIIVYCGGGTCEISIDMAWELIGYGHSPVGVYQGGFPEWEDSGKRVERAEAA